MPVIYESDDGEQTNMTGIGYGVMKGDIRPDEIVPGPEDNTIVIRGKVYRQTVPESGEEAARRRE